MWDPPCSNWIEVVSSFGEKLFLLLSLKTEKERKEVQVGDDV